jgi:hypothetical protein
VIRHNGRNLQLQPGQRHYGPTRSKALVREWEDGALQVYYRGERIGCTELKDFPKQIPQPVSPTARARMVRKAKPDHPWRQGFRNMKSWPPNQAVAAPLVGMRTYASP